MRRMRHINPASLLAALVITGAVAGALSLGAVSPGRSGCRQEDDGDAPAAGSPGCSHQPERCGRDWEAVLAEAPDAVAWLHVEDTPIDAPVLSSAEPYFYLRHDAAGNFDVEGSLTLDEYCPGADSRHVVVYGHHLGQRRLFGSIYDCNEPGPFSALETMTFETPGAGARRLVPLCASSVHKSDLATRVFDFADDDSFREWLAGLCEGADVQADGWESLCAGAESAVTCVTCTSSRAGQPWRTLVTFVEA